MRRVALIGIIVLFVVLALLATSRQEPREPAPPAREQKIPVKAPPAQPKPVPIAEPTPAASAPEPPPKAEPAYLGRDVISWKEQLAYKNGTHRAEAAYALFVLRPHAAAAIPELTEAIKEPNPALRLNAARALAPYGDAAVCAVPVLIDFAERSDRALQLEAIETLGEIGPRATAALPTLRNIIAVPEEPRRAAFLALGKMGGEALPILEEALQWHLSADKMPDGLIEGLGAARKAGVPALVKALHLRLDQDGRKILRTLGEMGKDAQDAQAEVKDIMARKDADEELRQLAQSTLARMAESPR